MALRNYTELIAWQKSLDLVERVYEATRLFPREEIYGLTSQLRRAVVSIPSNIAEGQGRQTTRDFLRFLSIAHGSLREVETQLFIAHRLRYISAVTFDEAMEVTGAVGRLINGLTNTLERRMGAS